MQEGAHALRRERVCVPERYRVPQDGRTSLQLAVIFGCNEVVKKLLEAGAATDATDKVTGKGA